jgi:hypothetical protein
MVDSKEVNILLERHRPQYALHAHISHRGGVIKTSYFMKLAELCGPVTFGRGTSRLGHRYMIAACLFEEVSSFCVVIPHSNRSLSPPVVSDSS